MKTTLTRNSYGTLVNTHTTNSIDRALLSAAYNLVNLAAASGKITKSHDSLSRDRKGRWDGSAVNHEIYDISPTASRVLVCIRETEGSKYGVKTLSKDYYLVGKCGKGVTVAPVSKAIAAKAAKAHPDEIGHGIAIVTGKEKLKGKAPEIRTGYKAVTIEAETPVSVWDGSAWEIGKTRIEAASEDHAGGFYYYRNISEVIAAAQENNIFGSARSHRNLVVVKVEASGKEFSHGPKLCCSKMKPIEIVASIL